MNEENIKMDVVRTPILVMGGRMHGRTVDIEFAEGIVHVLDGEEYSCVRLCKGQPLLVHHDMNVENIVATTLSFI